MEADGSSGNFCGYCNKPGHQSDQCRERTSDRRLEIALGFSIGLILVPFAIIGYILGVIAGSVWGGMSYSFKHWSEWVAYMKRLFGKAKE